MQKELKNYFTILKQDFSILRRAFTSETNSRCASYYVSSSSYHRDLRVDADFAYYRSASRQPPLTACIFVIAQKVKVF